MDRRVILISKNKGELEQIHQLLYANNYETHCIEDLSQIENTIKKAPCNCIIFDLDSIDIDSRAIRELTIRHPLVYLLCMSKDRFHPELKDAICYHIYACLTKPLNHDELLYWLRCIDTELDLTPSDSKKEL